MLQNPGVKAKRICAGVSTRQLTTSTHLKGGGGGLGGGLEESASLHKGDLDPP